MHIYLVLCTIINHAVSAHLIGPLRYFKPEVCLWLEQVRAALAPEPQEASRVPVAFGGPTLAFPPPATGALDPAPPPWSRQAELLLRRRPQHSTRRCSEQRLPAALQPSSTTGQAAHKSRQRHRSFSRSKLPTQQPPSPARLPSACTHGNPWMSRYVLGHCLACLGG